MFGHVIQIPKQIMLTLYNGDVVAAVEELSAFMATLSLVPYGKQTPCQNRSFKGKNYKKVLRIRRQKYEIS